MYCGDETGAFIGDVGSHSSRFGYGGEDCPKVVVPSAAYSRTSSSKNGDDGGVGVTAAGRGGKNARRRKKYSVPVSLMRMPPDDCFSASDEAEAEDVGFVPIYRSLNSNDQKKSHPNGNANVDDGLIQDMGAWASAWEYSYEALCVRGKGKHTRGHKYRDEPELRPEGAPSRSRVAPSEPETDGGGPIDHPLLAVDSTSRTLPVKDQEKQRALMLETLFEQLSAPAAYIAPSPMLSSFAYGRQTSLVVDVGHSGSRVTPLVDGYCLNVGSTNSGRGGRWLGDVQKSVLEGGMNDGNGNVGNKWNGWGDGKNESGLPPCREEGIIPRYLLHPNAEKYSDKKLQILKRSPFHSMAMHEVMYEMMTSSHIPPLERSEENANSPPFCGYGEDSVSVDNGSIPMDEDKKMEEVDEEGQSCYILPDGTRVDLSRSRAGRDLCRVPELLLSETLPSFTQPQANAISEHAPDVLPLHQLIHKSLTQILDVDLRKELSSNIILTGGASLFPNLDKGLSVELGRALPGSYKYKVIASKNSVENRYSAWIGGSILSSLGSFQQLWLSKKEYDECGAVLGLQRFKN